MAKLVRTMNNFQAFVWISAAMLIIGHIADPHVHYMQEEPGEALVYHGIEAQPPAVPWHAGIYQPIAGAYSFLCGGTLIAPHLLVTAAHCFWDENGAHPEPDLASYMVAMGKFYRAWHLDAGNHAVQRVRVKQIALHPRFRGYRRKLEYDLAVVELMVPVNMTSSVATVMVDWDRQLDDNQPTGSEGLVAGWGISEDGDSSEVLRSIRLPYIEHDLCYETIGQRFRHLMTGDKICGGFVNESRGVCQGDSGGGYVFRDGEQTLVRGVVSLNFRPREYPGACYAESYAGFTNIAETRTLEWIAKIFPSARASFPCPPQHATGETEVECRLDNTIVNCSMPALAGTVAEVRCQRPETVNNQTGQQVNRATCKYDGSWSQPLGACERAHARLCPALISSASVLVTKCLVNSEPVNCSLPMIVGTRAMMRCKENFFSTDSTTKTVSCTMNFTWTSPIICIPDCGRRSRSDVHTSVIGGENVEVGDMPWHVTIYRREVDSTEVDTWGGTLITPTCVLTNAFVVFAGVNTTQNKTLFTVVARKYIDSIHIYEEHVQERNVSAIFMHDQYDFQYGNQAQDIALIHVLPGFELSWAVNVACVDWANQMEPAERDFVIVASWRNSKNNTAVKVLAPEIRTVVSRATCRDAADAARRQYVTPDKLCAAPAILGDVCLTIDGSGLIFARRTSRGSRRYVVGVRSVVLADGKVVGCFDDQLAGFTRVATHLAWIKERISWQ